MKNFLFILLVWLLFITSLSSSLWLPLVVKQFGELDTGITVERYPGQDIQRASDHSIYFNPLDLKQVFPGSRQLRNPTATLVRGYFLQYPYRMFVYEDAPYVNEWFSNLANPLLMVAAFIFLWGLIMNWIRERKVRKN